MLSQNGKIYRLIFSTNERIVIYYFQIRHSSLAMLPLSPFANSVTINDLIVYEYVVYLFCFGLETAAKEFNCSICGKTCKLRFFICVFIIYNWKNNIVDMAGNLAQHVTKRHADLAAAQNVLFYCYYCRPGIF